MPATPKTKYRPVLTADQIEHVLTLCKNQSPLTELDISLISTLAPFQAKIQNAGIAAAYTTTPKPNLLESLGATPTSSTPDISKEHYWENCYLKLEQYGSDNLTIAEIKAAHEWRYLNDMMTPEEELEFESIKAGMGE